MLPKQAIIEYQVVYKQEYGHSISYELAVEQATKLFNLFKLLTESPKPCS